MKPLTLNLTREQVDWEALYQEQLPKIYNYFRYRVGDGMLAEDLTAATFEKAWRARKSYQRKKAAFTTWLYTIARNILADHYRKTRDEISLPSTEQLAAEDSEPEDELISQQTLQGLIALLNEYPPRERDLVALKYGAGLNNRQIAQMTSLSESNVGTILHRLVSNLRTEMEQQP